MSDRISAVTRSAPTQPIANPPRESGACWAALLGRGSAVAPSDRVDAQAPAPAGTPVRPVGFGRDGRFEKFILALQALRIDAGALRTDRIERMHDAAEELFGIDGMPEMMPPRTVSPATPAPAEVREPVARGDLDAALVPATVEAAGPPDTGAGGMGVAAASARGDAAPKPATPARAEPGAASGDDAKA